MIQRIQTIYLVVAEVLVGFLFFLPLGEIVGKEQSIYRVDLRGIYLEGIQKQEIVQSNLPLFIVWIVSLILPLVAIFLFENRKLQMRLSMISILILLGLNGLIFYEVWSIAVRLTAPYSLTIYFVFPLIAAILTFMAFRSIRKDELLVRSIDRIR